MPTTTTRLQSPDDHERSPTAATLEACWSRIQDALRARIRREQFDTWFRRTELAHLDEERLCLVVRNAFVRDWLLDYFRDELKAAVEQALGAPREIEIRVDPERAAAVAPAETPVAPPPAVPSPPPKRVEPRSESPSAAADEPGGLLGASDVSLNPYYRFDNFIVGPCNRFAHAACQGVAEAPRSKYNPLFLYGGSGLGKTHLMQSLCHAVLEREPGTRILYLSCETFVNHFISALEHGNLTRFRDKYRTVDVLVVDDIHLLANKERTQEEFFHTFNTLYNAGAHIVLSADSRPVEIPTLKDRLVSRLSWGLVTLVEPPCYETRVAIVKRKSRERGRELPDDLARFLAERIETNVRELEGAVNRLLGFAGLSGQELNLSLVRQCLRELFARQTGQPSIDDIMQVVTAHFGAKLSDLQSRRRTSAIVLPRQVGMYLARRLTRMSLEEIGHYFGGRDHSTVFYAIEKIGELAREGGELQPLIRQLLLELHGPDTT